MRKAALLPNNLRADPRFVPPAPKRANRGIQRGEHKGKMFSLPGLTKSAKKRMVEVNRPGKEKTFAGHKKADRAINGGGGGQKGGRQKHGKFASAGRRGRKGGNIPLGERKIGKGGRDLGRGKKGSGKKFIPGKKYPLRRLKPSQ